MANRIIDLTGSSPPRTPSPTTEVRIQALLTTAIDDASPDRLRRTLHEPSTTSNAFARAISDLLLITRHVEEDSPRDSVNQDSNMEDTDETDTEEHYDKGVARQPQSIGQKSGPVRIRYAKCINCEEEFDVSKNWYDEGCNYHDGILRMPIQIFEIGR